MRELELVADALDRLVEAEPRFDADHEQIERVGQPEPDAMLAALRHASERHARQQVAERAAGRAPAPGSACTMIGVASSANTSERAAEADAEEHGDRFVAAVAGR